VPAPSASAIDAEPDPADALFDVSLAFAVPVFDGAALLVFVAVVNGVLGIAGGLVEPPLRAVTLSHAPAALHGVAASFLQLTQRLSATYVVALATGILLGAAGGVTAESLQRALLVCGAFVLLSSIVSLDPSLRRAADALRGVATPGERPADSGDTGAMPNAAVTWNLETVPWDDPRAVLLRAEMDGELGPRYADRLDDIPPEVAARFGQALSVDPDTIVATIIAVDAEGDPVGHAALRDLGGELAGSLEVKRVFVAPPVRGTGVSRLLMGELERIAADRGAERLILQTGDRQPDAIALYEKIGYTPIPVYPPYVEITFSHCFEKPVPA